MTAGEHHSISGHSISGHSISGHSISGHSISGHGISGHSISGHGISGHSTAAPELDHRYRGTSFDDLMATVDFRVGSRAHIVVDSDVCRSCTTKACVTACPANLFAPTADGGVLFNYEECFECGTCYMVCNHEGALSWTYPDGGHGVEFRHG